MNKGDMTSPDELYYVNTKAIVNAVPPVLGSRANSAPGANVSL